MTVRSDTAGPTDHAGLVAELRSHADTQIDDNLAYIKKADELMHRAAEAIAALSRAPEAKDWSWNPAIDAARPTLVATPPAPQPALALIEELEAALQAMMSERANGPDSYRIWGQAGTALASAKRFKGA